MPCAAAWASTRLDASTVSMATSVGAKIGKGDKLFMMEAMKMQTTVYAQCDGVVVEVNAAVGETVEAKDLIVKLRA